MGVFKNILIEEMELAYPYGPWDMDEYWRETEPQLEPEPNEFEQALITGERLMGKENNFVTSCWQFYRRNKYLSEAQIYRLEHPKFRKRY